MKKYKTISDFEKHVRKNGTEDMVQVDGMIFTMDSYDSEGKEISYGNIRYEKSLFVATENRYGKNKFKDAICYIIDLCSYRTDIVYAQ